MGKNMSLKISILSVLMFKLKKSDKLRKGGLNA